MEIWKKVKHYGIEYDYEISSKGRLRNMKGYIMKPMIWKNYYMYKLCKNGSYVRELAHRLTAMMFIECSNNFKDMQVNHINGDKHDNRIENLEWVTPRENIEHASNTGLHNGIAYQKVIAYKEDKVYGEYESINKASKGTGVNVGNISQILSGKIQQSKGFTFERKCS